MQESLPNRPPHCEFEFASVPWYTDAACYEWFRASADDADLFFETFQHWLTVALEHERQAERQGVPIIRIRMEKVAFERWRQRSSAKNNVAGRSSYAEEQAQKLMPR